MKFDKSVNILIKSEARVNNSTICMISPPFSREDNHQRPILSCYCISLNLANEIL